MSTIQASFGTDNLSNKSIWASLGHERLHSLRNKAILEEEKRCASLPREETRITSREIIPTGMIFLPFLPSQRKLRTSFPIAFACVSGNEEGALLSGWPGTITRKAEFMGTDRLLA
jgi:hypothetical protein